MAVGTGQIASNQIIFHPLLHVALNQVRARLCFATRLQPEWSIYKSCYFNVRLDHEKSILINKQASEGCCNAKQGRQGPVTGPFHQSIQHHFYPLSHRDGSPELQCECSLRVSNQPTVHDFWMWEETGVSRENLHRHRENMHMPHRKVEIKEMKAGSYCCGVPYTRVLPLYQYHSIYLSHILNMFNDY